MQIPLNNTTVAIPVFVGTTGLTLTAYGTKNGAAQVTLSGAVTEIGHGMYSVAANATDANTAGSLGVTLSDGTHQGATVVDVGPYQANLLQILGTALTETIGGYLAAGFRRFFNVATPVLTVGSVNQSGDSYPLINGMPQGITGTVLASPAPTILSFAISVPSAYSNTDFTDSFIVFSSSATVTNGLAYQIGSYNISTGVVNVTDLNAPPTAGDAFILIGRVGNLS